MAKTKWSRAGSEPTLWEALADPIVVSLMRADGVARKDVLLAVARAPDGHDAEPHRPLTERLGILV
jgi:hypothetical protein